MSSYSVAVNDRVSPFVQSATDTKVQAVVLLALVSLCVVSAVAFATASLSGRLTMPEGLATSAALLVIAYGLILGIQYLQPNNEVDLEIDDLSDVSSVNSEDFEDALDLLIETARS
jgi:hypothetical protein